MFSKMVCLAQMGYLKMMNVYYAAYLFTGNSLSEVETPEKPNEPNAGGGVDVEALLNRTGAEKEGGVLNPISEFIQNMGSGAYNISLIILTYAAVIGLVITAIGFAIHGNNVQKRTENREGLGYKILGIVLGFAAGGIVVIANTVGKGLFIVE